MLNVPATQAFVALIRRFLFTWITAFLGAIGLYILSFNEPSWPIWLGKAEQIGNGLVIAVLLSAPLLAIGVMTILNVSLAAFWRLGYLQEGGWWFWGWRMAGPTLVLMLATIALVALICNIYHLAFGDQVINLAIIGSFLYLAAPWPLAKRGIYAYARYR